jgi:hypothetical protein
MWLLPLLALGLALALTGHRERGLATALPGPLAVLSECMRTGRPPPPQVSGAQVQALIGAWKQIVGHTPRRGVYGYRGRPVHNDAD